MSKNLNKDVLEALRVPNAIYPYLLNFVIEK